jgi:hypothetical protein
MNKQELRKRIESLPLFELRRVKVKCDISEEKDDWQEPVFSRAICKLEENIPCAYVGSRYDLIQFKDVFLPILDSIDVDLNGTVLDWGGYAQLIMFPDMSELKDGETQFGLVAANSVDCSSAVIVKFCIAHKDTYLVVPAKIAGLKRKHTGKVKGIVKDYVQLVGTVRELWKNIIAEFPKYNVAAQLDPMKENELEFKEVLKSLHIGTRLGKALEDKFQHANALGKQYTLWDLFIDTIAAISERDYKSMVHRQKRIEQLSENVFKYATMLGI